MFTGLTWFGIPLEYFMRFSEFCFIVAIGAFLYGFFGDMIKDKWRNK